MMTRSSPAVATVSLSRTGPPPRWCRDAISAGTANIVSASAAPAMAPVIWQATTAAARLSRPLPGPRRPSIQSAAVTTGLKCAPPAGASTMIRTASPAAVASEFTSSRTAPSPVSRVTAIPDPTTTATSSPVPVNSAISRRAAGPVTSPMA
jgi:hypothetical protein